ncbi:hypothetical protein BVG16_17175 [Paenibacillus selenitireducens]|uniref:DUF3949 domain-containing protein n=1 Tax=Paenibacillus selenitireducens TaxID=1324314 RepID=A0A1T2XAS6_9BACL|nr:DUF3949 domain-containing protein [Paenibacillus selenitireducens]OPA77001.1 hypothetical protein BVG16_17175 [Paenibacillus selenitireducens]
MITAILIGIAVVYFLIMIPIQYSYISELKKLQLRTGGSQSEMYEKMTFENEQSHFAVQGNIFNIPSTLIASLIYKLRHK